MLAQSHACWLASMEGWGSAVGFVKSARQKKHGERADLKSVGVVSKVILPAGKGVSTLCGGDWRLLHSQ